MREIKLTRKNERWYLKTRTGHLVGFILATSDSIDRLAAANRRKSAKNLKIAISRIKFKDSIKFTNHSGDGEWADFRDELYTELSFCVNGLIQYHFPHGIPDEFYIKFLPQRPRK
jgi:hypothetical protein